MPTQLENECAKQLREIEQMKTCVFPYLSRQLAYDRTSKEAQDKGAKKKTNFHQGVEFIQSSLENSEKLYRMAADLNNSSKKLFRIITGQARSIRACTL